MGAYLEVRRALIVHTLHQVTDGTGDQLHHLGENRTHHRGPGEQKACDCCHSTQDTTLTINELDLHKKPKALECGLVGWPRDTTLGWMMGEMTRLGSPAHSAGEFTLHKGPGEEQYIFF